MTPEKISSSGKSAPSLMSQGRSTLSRVPTTTAHTAKKMAQPVLSL